MRQRVPIFNLTLAALFTGHPRTMPPPSTQHPRPSIVYDNLLTLVQQLFHAPVHQPRRLLRASLLIVSSCCLQTPLSACFAPPPELMNVMPEDTMTQYPYILFNKSPEQLRRLGALGGRAYGRNQRIRRAQLSTPPLALPPHAVPQETAAKAIHLLDTQFPWLRGAERHPSRNRVGQKGIPLSGSFSGR